MKLLFFFQQSNLHNLNNSYIKFGEVFSNIFYYNQDLNASTLIMVILYVAAWKTANHSYILNYEILGIYFLQF